MANQVNVTDSIVYVELDGSSIIVTDALVYIELNSSELRVTDSLVYVEYAPIPAKIELIYAGTIFELQSVTVKQTLSTADITTLLSEAKEKLPIIPDWQIDIAGFWSVKIANKVGNLSDQVARSISLHVTDRYGDSVDLTNSESFIANYSTDINIDNAMIYKITFVGSGVLTTT